MNPDLAEYLEVLGFAPTAWGDGPHRAVATAKSGAPEPTPTSDHEFPGVVFWVEAAPSPEEKQILTRMAEAMGLMKSDWMISADETPATSPYLVIFGSRSTPAPGAFTVQVPSAADLLRDASLKRTAWTELQRVMAHRGQRP